MRRCLVVLILAALSGIAQPPPYRESEMVMPDDASRQLKGVLYLHVGFNALYRAAHIPGSIYAGPGSKLEGLEVLKKAVAHEPRDREIVLYCGCCPWENCPNVRPALRTLQEMGFKKVRILVIPGNFKVDWVDKGYPTEKRAE